MSVRAISVFQEKFDVELTRQAVNFSVQFCLKLVCTPQQRVMRAYLIGTIGYSKNCFVATTYGFTLMKRR